MKNLQITPMITNRDEDSLDIYLNNISKEKSITPEDEKELARRIHQGDKHHLDYGIQLSQVDVIHRHKIQLLNGLLDFVL